MRARTASQERLVQIICLDLLNGFEFASNLFGDLGIDELGVAHLERRQDRGQPTCHAFPRFVKKLGSLGAILTDGDRPR